MAREKRKSRFAGKTGQNARKQQQQGSSYGYLMLPRDVRVFSPDVGKRAGDTTKASFDILPYVVSDVNHPDRDERAGIAMPKDLWYKRPFKIHRNVGGDSVVCPSSVGKACPICQWRKTAIKSGESKEATDAVKLSERNLYVIIPLGNKEYKEEPHIWDISQAMFQRKLGQEILENEACECFPDLENGLTLNVRFEAKTIGSGDPFPETSRIDFEERKESYGEDILKKVPDLDKILKILSYKELEKKFLEVDEEPEGEPVTETQDDTPTEEASEPESEAEPEQETESEAEPEQEPEENLCIACEGEGKNSKGNTCRICNGTGKGKETPAEPPKQESKKPEKPGKPNKKAKGDCPHDHKFGDDFEKHDECNACDKWDACMEEKEKK